MKNVIVGALTRHKFVNVDTGSKYIQCIYQQIVVSIWMWSMETENGGSSSQYIMMEDDFMCGDNDVIM